ncbi:hypothetical protein PDO_4385 [Rhizobium sp. PDO1-076]|uniref:hypothetical protein n=1 Tax=Rhizobium sp. PDO1-076 TaxID=1125979 RepID=UPI00024E254C|nr:hypothetical protein [Rhizobium sp. PDO1-076]EHS53154.1 hypothetical protein PDO_4385 [Rhizobium sp. PDO1-076]
MLRAFRLALCLACLGLSSVAGVAQAASRTQADLQLVNDNGDVIIQSQSRRQRQPGVRPQRYYCVIPPSGTRNGGAEASCPASPGRVGGSCRCANAIGSGVLQTY